MVLNGIVVVALVLGAGGSVCWLSGRGNEFCGVSPEEVRPSGLKWQGCFCTYLDISYIMYIFELSFASGVIRTPKKNFSSIETCSLCP